MRLLDKKHSVIPLSRKALIVFIVAIVSMPVQAGDTKFPDWLAGKPDVAMRPDRCGVYEWFFDEADRQTEGIASKDCLASQRVVNIANKLVDYHRTNPQEEYSGKVKYLVSGETGPFHFEFLISNEELEKCLNKSCRYELDREGIASWSLMALHTDFLK